MPEILTESFCERCGTRYTFESAAPTKTRKLGRFKTTAKGLRNYVLSDDTSLDEAMAAARSDTEREQTSQQLDAFHSTFNFCMNCRQYTCGNCWNEVEGRCLTCSPHLGHEIMPAPFPDMPAPFPGLSASPVDAGPGAWPDADLPEVAAAAAVGGALASDAIDAGEAGDDVPDIDAADRLDRLSATQDDVVPQWLSEAEAAALSAAEAHAVAEAVTEHDLQPEPETPFETVAEVQELEVQEPVAATVEDAPIEPVAETARVVMESPAEPVAAVAEPELAPAEIAAVHADPDATEPVPDDALDDRAAAAAAQTSVLFAKFRPGQSIDAELEAYEAAMAADTVSDVDDTLPAEPAAAAAAATALVAAAAHDPEPEPVAAAPEAAAAWPEPEPVIDHDVAAAVAAAALVAANHEPEPEPIAAAAEAAPLEPEPVAVEAAAPEPEPEPIAAAAEAAPLEPEPVAVEAAAPEPEPEPIAAAAAAAVETTPEPARTDVVEQPTWRIIAPDSPAPVTNGHDPEALPAAATAVPTAPPEPAAPQWPTAPEWPQPNAALLAQRPPPTTSPAMEALWVASARDVVGQTQGGPVGGVQPCTSCGLSLSANARFCRRCGTRQG